MHTLNEANYIVANPVDLFYVDTLAWKWERALATKPFICWFQQNHGIVFSFLFKTTNIQTIGYSRDITWQMRHNQTLVVWPQTFSISLTMLECNVVLTITQNETFFLHWNKSLENAFNYGRRHEVLDKIISNLFNW